jgi:hypothetical protein
MVNFTPGENIANQGAVMTWFSTGATPELDPDIKIYASAATDVVVDVVGYWYPATNEIVDDDFATGTGAALNPDIFFKFLVEPAVVEVTGPDQFIHVVSHKAMGSTLATGALNLMLSICYDTPGGALTNVTTYVTGLRVPQGSRIPMGLSAIFSGLAPGVYDVGLCGRVTAAGNVAQWNNNGRGYTSAFVVHE